MTAPISNGPTTHGYTTMRDAPLRRCGSGEYVMRLIPAHAGKTREPGHKEEPTEAHPRSRGENVPVSAGSAWRFGSSPLTRGKLEVRGACPSRCRLIPAHAGKTAGQELNLTTAWAHPRSRGENRRQCSWVSRGAGSSPLTRGKPIYGGVADYKARLIPAHAGKTSPVWAAPPPSAAHPRSRGENRRLPGRLGLGIGSSPLTRGKHPSKINTQGKIRLIPAHAGKTTPLTSHPGNS